MTIFGGTHGYPIFRQPQMIRIVGSPLVLVSSAANLKKNATSKRHAAQETTWTKSNPSNNKAYSFEDLQVEVKVVPHCPFWVFPIVNAVSKKSSLSHPFDGFPHVNARFTEWFFITYDLEIVEIIAFCWWAAILLNAKRYSRKIISAWQRWENISWTGRTLFLTPGTQKLPHPNGTQGYPRPSGSYPRDQILLAH